MPIWRQDHITVNSKLSPTERKQDPSGHLKLSEASMTLIWRALQIEIPKLPWLKIIGEMTMNKNGLVKTFNLKFATQDQWFPISYRTSVPEGTGQHVGLTLLAIVLIVFKDARAFSAWGRPLTPFSERESVPLLRDFIISNDTWLFTSAIIARAHSNEQGVLHPNENKL